MTYIRVKTQITDYSPQMPWYGQEWGESAPHLEMLSHGHAYTATSTEVLHTAFLQQGCYLRNWEDEKRMSDALTGFGGHGEST